MLVSEDMHMTEINSCIYDYISIIYTFAAGSYISSFTNSSINISILDKASIRIKIMLHSYGHCACIYFDNFSLLVF